MNDTATAAQKHAVIMVASALLEAVQACPNGAPAGPLYAASMGLLSLDQFQQVMGLLVKAGRVTKRGHCYYPVN